MCGQSENPCSADLLPADAPASVSTDRSANVNVMICNRSALGWAINQYRVTEHKRSGIVSDPNPDDDPEYTVCLLGR